MKVHRVCGTRRALSGNLCTLASAYGACEAGQPHSLERRGNHALGWARRGDHARERRGNHALNHAPLPSGGIRAAAEALRFDERLVLLDTIGLS